MRWILASLVFALTVTYMLAEEPAEVQHSISGRAEEEQLQRVKRISINDDDVEFDTETNSRPKQKSKTFRASAKDGTEYNFPVVLPPYGHNSSLTPDLKCLFYLENITVVVLDISSIETKHNAYSVVVGGGKSDKFTASDGHYRCPEATGTNITNPTFSFTVDMNLADTYTASVDSKPVFEVTGRLTIQLNFNESFGINLLGANLDEIHINVKDSDRIKSPLNPGGPSVTGSSTNIRSYYGYNFACGSTQAIWFNATADYFVGIVLNNVQIQSFFFDEKNPPADVKMRSFSRNTADCQSTFSPGSWMGIIVTLVLVTVLMFGFLMLNSVQTMDRFDDPKQKQIVINFKE